MKTIKLFFTVTILLVTVSFAKAQNYNYKLDGPFTATKTFRVNGVCEMCKHRIESAVNKLPGIWSSYWDINSKTLLVKYDRSRIEPDRIKQLVTTVGHDTERAKASDVVYNALPDCCHYPRKS